MSYLKIFPRLILMKRDGVGDYKGKMAYDFEQYGRMLYDAQANVELQCQANSEWLIRSTTRIHSLAGFSVFMLAINHYMFEVLQFDPVSQWDKVTGTNYEYYFDRVFFDMGTRQFNTSKALEVPDDVKSSGNFFRKNIQS